MPRRGDHFSRTTVARRLQRPTRKETGTGRPGSPRTANSFLFDLAPDGVYRAKPVTRSAGELLPHRFTLTADKSRRRSLLCGTFPGLAAGGRYPPSHPPEPGLSSRRLRNGTKSADSPKTAGDRPAHSDSTKNRCTPAPDWQVSGRFPPGSDFSNATLVGIVCLDSVAAEQARI